jgi:hypothetical protein
MGRALIVVLLPFLFAACAASSAPKDRGDRCLYAVEGIEAGRMMVWGSCANPPRYAIERLSD